MKKITSISLACLLLASHLSLAVGTHFCGGRAVKTELMFGHQHLDCGMSGMDDDDHDPNNDIIPQVEKFPCCQNEYASFAVDEDFKIPSPEKLLNFEFVAAFITPLLEPLSYAKVTLLAAFRYFSPPLPDKNIQILFQTFLI